MDTDMKWVLLLVILFIGMPMVGLALSDYQHSQCRIEAIKAGVEADKINVACGIK
jgi:CHASE1-domain containing sensor protein